MEDTALTHASSRGQRLAYVTEHHRDLQGLRMAPFWAALLVMTSLAKSGSVSRGHLAWAAVAIVVSSFGWLRLSGYWYEQRYGVVKEPSGPGVRSGLISIMHPESKPQRGSNKRYGYRSETTAILFLIWMLSILPDIFLGRHGRPWALAMFLTGYQILPRCFYPVTHDWSIRLRRILACAALIAIIGAYIDHRFVQMDLWTWMTASLSVLLLLDLYDHWLLNHLLSGGPAEWSHE